MSTSPQPLAIGERIGTAPITWGIDGSPGWGYLMPRDRVIGEMAALGFRATELGPDGYLPQDPAELVAYLDGFGMRLVGGWVPLVLTDAALTPAQEEYLRRACAQFAAGGASVLVLGVPSTTDGYDVRIEPTEEQWQIFFSNLMRVRDIATEYGLTTSLHQHLGTTIEGPADVDRVLANTDVQFCIDTGHMLAAGIDPVAWVAAHAERVAHVHLKDVSESLAAQVRSGQRAFREACLAGLFQPLGRGDVDLATVIETLEQRGYRGWYVVEQDCSLTEEPPAGAGPVGDARISWDYLATLAGV